jgi:hypothetical protein
MVFVYVGVIFKYSQFYVFSLSMLPSLCFHELRKCDVCAIKMAAPIPDIFPIPGVHL